MKLKEIYRKVVRKGIKEDQRPKRLIEDDLKKARAEYRGIKKYEQRLFDIASLDNPYSDTRILNGSGDEDVSTVLVGIDIDVQELLLADRLREKGTRIDLVISHHPSGRAYAELYKVMGVQPGMWEKYGLKPEVGRKIMSDREDKVARSLSPVNHMRAVDAARLLHIPFMCMHTAADNCVAGYLQKAFDTKKPLKLRNVMSFLKKLPEYREAMRNGAGPYILVGDDNAEAGKIFVDMTGGASGPDRIFSRFSQSGVNTIVGMTCKEEAFRTAKAEFLNYIVAGHIASDNLGMNLMLDEVDKAGTMNIIECSGFRRFKRNK